MATIRQSDLASFSYCALRQAYERQAKREGTELRRLSGTIFGSVVHYALMVMQQAISEGRDDALEYALATFEHYWHPDHTGEVCEGAPNEWMRGHTWHGLLANGKKSLRKYYEWRTEGPGKKDVVLAVEQSFDIDFELDGEWHVFHGTVDLLSLRATPTHGLHLSVDDHKTGRKPDHLQYATQWSVYAWASRNVQFWNPFLEVDGFDEIERRVEARGFNLYDAPNGRPTLPRRGRWFRVQNGEFSVHDCGERTDQHTRRFMGQVRQYLAAQKAGIFPFTTDTKKCAFCQFRHTCGDAPLPDYQEGVDE